MVTEKYRQFILLLLFSGWTDGIFVFSGYGEAVYINLNLDDEGETELPLFHVNVDNQICIKYFFCIFANWENLSARNLTY